MLRQGFTSISMEEGCSTDVDNLDLKHNDVNLPLLNMYSLYISYACCKCSVHFSPLHAVGVTLVKTSVDKHRYYKVPKNSKI